MELKGIPKILANYKKQSRENKRNSIPEIRHFFFENRYNS
jgi:hypothetical protein